MKIPRFLSTSLSILVLMVLVRTVITKIACAIAIFHEIIHISYVTGLAYAFQEDIYINSKWNSTRYGATVKPKTIILLDDKGKIISFGMDAKITYVHIQNFVHVHISIISFIAMYQLHDVGFIQKDKWMLFNRFKMALYGMIKLKSFIFSIDYE